MAGAAFAVWAPNAKRVSLVGDFNRWDGRVVPDARARRRAASGSSSCPGVGAGTIYKFELKTQEGMLRLKTDPLAREMEHPPATAARVERLALHLARRRLDAGARTAAIILR